MCANPQVVDFASSCEKVPLSAKASLSKSARLLAACMTNGKPAMLEVAAFSGRECQGKSATAEEARRCIARSSSRKVCSRTGLEREDAMRPIETTLTSSRFVESNSSPRSGHEADCTGLKRGNHRHNGRCSPNISLWPIGCMLSSPTLRRIDTDQTYGQIGREAITSVSFQRTDGSVAGLNSRIATNCQQLPQLTESEAYRFSPARHKPRRSDLRPPHPRIRRATIAPHAKSHSSCPRRAAICSLRIVLDVADSATSER